jgi:hypothetical protein
VPLQEKKAVYQSYGLHYGRGLFEVDHLISLELGGSNDQANLWPQPYGIYPGAHEKDKVENRLHQLVCRGQLRLEEAQNIIAHSWTDFYFKNVVHEKPTAIRYHRTVREAPGS